MVNGRRATFDPIMPARLMNSERSVDCGAAIALCHRGCRSADSAVRRFDDLAHLVRHVGWQIVDNHDVTRPQRWCQVLRPCAVLLAASSSRAFRGSLRR